MIEIRKKRSYNNYMTFVSVREVSSKSALLVFETSQSKRCSDELPLNLLYEFIIKENQLEIELTNMSEVNRAVKEVLTLVNNRVEDLTKPDSVTMSEVTFLKLLIGKLTNVDKLTQPRSNLTSSLSSSQLGKQADEPDLEGIAGKKVSICYSASTGQGTAEILESELKEKSLQVRLIPCSDSTDAVNIDALDNINLLVLVLTKDCLRLPSLQQVAKVAIDKTLRIVLVHDQESCVFPSLDEQPNFMQLVFHDKAITFLKQYSKTTSNQIAAKLIKPVGSQVSENIQTRAFLSHKRSSAQGMTGRIYEGLKGYRVFLDSEALFDLHDLSAIVKQTGLFVFILSEGILDSKWCLIELQSAIEAKRRILVIRDCTYKLPDPLPPQALPFKDVILNSPRIDYMAEFYQDCIKKIIEELGPTDGAIEWLENGDNADSAKKIRNKEANVDLSFTLNAEVSLSTIKHALDKYYFYPLDNIVSLSIKLSEPATIGDTHFREDELVKKLISISMGESIITNETIKYIVSLTKNIAQWNIGSCKHLTDNALISIGESGAAASISRIQLQYLPIEDTGFLSLAKGSGNIQFMNLTSLRKINDETFITLLKANPNIKHLILDSCKGLTSNSFSAIGDYCKSIEVLECAHNEGVTDDVIQRLSENCHLLTKIVLHGCKKLTDAAITHLSKLRYITVLNLNWLPITDEGVNTISKSLYSSQLLEINMVANKALTDDGLRHLADLQNLTTILIGGTFVTNAGLQHLVQLPKLRYLNARRSKATKDILQSFPSISVDV